MIDENINTEGKFEFRVKPKIEHGMAFLNRSVEEIQQIIVSNKESAETFVTNYKAMEDKVNTLEAEVEGLKQIVGEKNG
jgi:prophage DNA circulation protein